MTDEIVARLRRIENGTSWENCAWAIHEAADEIERLRARVAELERFAGELDASGRKNTEPAALRGTAGDAVVEACVPAFQTRGESVQTEKTDG